MIYLSPPHLGEREAELLQEALLSNWIAPLGPHLDRFELALAEVTQSPYAVGVSSGTAAIHLGLRLLGVSTGDEVITPSFSFVASASPITFLGATPVFIDSEPETWNMDPELLEKALKERKAKGKQVKAIVLVHAYGMPAMIDEILQLAKKYDVPVLEDAADALGATYQGIHVGTFGQIGVLSFNGNKIITTSSGGALLCKEESIAKRVRYLSTQAKMPFPYYEHEEVGYNYRLSNILAAIGIGQLSVLEERVARRRAIFSEYRNQLTPLEQISFTEERAGTISNRWLTIIKLNQGGWNSLYDKLKVAQIESRPVWKPLHLQKAFNGAPNYVNDVSETLFNQCLCLPSGSAMTQNQILEVCNIIKDQQKS